MVNNTTHNIIKNTKDISRESNTVNTNIAARTQEMIANFESRGFSKWLIQDIINSISATDRNHPTYWRADLLHKEIEKAHFLLTVVDNSTKEELDEYISELANSKHNIHRYQNNKNIAEKYKNYIWKTLYMLEEKDVKFKKDFDNIIILQAELIKTNTLLQAFSRYEQGAWWTSFSEPEVVNTLDIPFTTGNNPIFNDKIADLYEQHKSNTKPYHTKEHIEKVVSAINNAPIIWPTVQSTTPPSQDTTKKPFWTKSWVNLWSSFEKMKNDPRKFGDL